MTSISLDDVLGSFGEESRVIGTSKEGRLPLTAEQLLGEPSGNLFGLTQNVAMGWNPEEVNRQQFVIVSTHGGLQAEDGSPIALGYHTGHWEVHLLVRQAARTFRDQNTIPFAVHCSDPCDGRTQGTTGMFDSLPYRNDAAQVMRRLVRSLPTRDGVMGIGTCDKGLPAILLALAGSSDLPAIVVPGGVTLPAPDAEDAGAIQTIGVRFANHLISLEYAASMGCRVCGSSGGGCQFLGTAATAQVVAEGFGMSLPHSALAPSGEPIWLDMARRSALALIRLTDLKIPLSKILTRQALENAMMIHAAFGGSMNLLMHIPAVAYEAGLPLPTVEDWNRINRATPRLVDALPNGPRNHPTVQVFMAGGVPEVMLHLRRMGLLNLEALTVTGQTLGENLDWWAQSERRHAVRQQLASGGGINPDLVIMDADTARREGLTSTTVFPVGNIAPQGSVIKATAIDPSLVDARQVYYHRGPARVFTSERDAMRAIKGQSDPPIIPGDVIVLAGIGPSGTGMEETAQVTIALKMLPWGKHCALLTDARFSGVSTGACIGHIGPEALAGGPIGKLRDGDLIEIQIDRLSLSGKVNFLGPQGRSLSPDEAQSVLDRRPMHPDLAPDPRLPDDTRLWAALTAASGGTWRGCIYDVDRIIEVLRAGMQALGESENLPAPRADSDR
ncbi:MAG TPA: YjhG/YagF family D-xylonate dehydratase [Aggregatilineales bacterium]|nr:YjhG/YagF family D-xylonate dehydratase [Aggregatilineales bacterium]